MTGKMRFVAFAAAILIVFSAFGTLGASASTTYDATEVYKNGKYYSNLCAVELSGDGAQDTLAIALSQLGYHEGNSDAELDGLSADGNRDFVEYNVLYGKLDNDQGNGLSYGYYWCASFVNWCLRQAGVSKEASAGAEVSCQRWLASCKEAGIYSKKTGYTPKSADIIFFKDRGSQRTSTHIGLVLYSDGKRVYTIEGNTSNGSEFSSDGNYVALKSYPLTSSYIVGYATPKYNTVDGIERIDYSGESFGAGKYITTNEIYVYADNTYRLRIGKIEPFTVFSVGSVIDGALFIDGGCIKTENIVKLCADDNLGNSAADEVGTAFIAIEPVEETTTDGFENLGSASGNAFIATITSQSFLETCGAVVALVAVLFLIVLIFLAVRRYLKKKVPKDEPEKKDKDKKQDKKNEQNKKNKKGKKGSRSKKSKKKKKKSKSKKSKKNKKGKK